VALVLSGPAIIAWRDGGSLWKAWNSRLVMVTLKILHRKCVSKLHVFSWYAPTYCMLPVLPLSDCFVLLGDFNARVGSRQVADKWWNERGPHGYGELNGAGKELLAFVSVNTATICNTWFKKKIFINRLGNIQNQNNGTALILLSLVGSICGDVRVMHGAECNIDHKLLRMKLSVGNDCRNISLMTTVVNNLVFLGFV